MTTYKILRYFKDDPEMNRTLIARGLTLEEAQEHCSNPETSSSTCTDPELVAMTVAHGQWFDGYDAELGNEEEDPEWDIAIVDGEIRRVGLP